MLEIIRKLFQKLPLNFSDPTATTHRSEKP